MSDKTARQKIHLLLIAGMSSLIIGLGLDILNITPIIKKIATVSFVFTSGGLAILALCFCYWLIDVKKLFRKGSEFFIVVGMNSIFIYLFFEIGGANLISRFVNPFSKLFFSFAGELTVAMITSICVWSAMWYMCFWLYKNKMFIKI